MALLLHMMQYQRTKVRKKIYKTQRRLGMKKRISILAAAAAVLSSCGAASYTSSSGQRFEDGIYSRPRVEDTQKLMASKSETDELVQKTRSSEIYLSTDRTDGHRTDTLFIPEDKAAVINFSGTGTSVTVMDDPFEQVYFNTYPWTYYRPYTFSNFYWDPWYYGRYWGYYDPWYWGGWYRDPWFWGVGLAWDLWFYDPWFWGPAYPWYPHYCGWYGGWGPGLGWHGPGHVHGGHRRDVYFGSRISTGPRMSGSSYHRRGSSYGSGTVSDRTVSGTRVPVSRRGITTSSSTSRRVTSSASSAINTGNRGTSYSSSSARRVIPGNRTGVVATTRPSVRPGTGDIPGMSQGSSQAVSGARRSVHSYRGSSARTGSSATAGYRNSSSIVSGQTNYRRPAGSYTRDITTSYGNTTPSYNRSSATSGFRNSTGTSYNRSASSSFNRSSSYSRSSSVSRSSSFSGSRSSGYSGGSRSSGGGSSSVRRR